MKLLLSTLLLLAAPFSAVADPVLPDVYAGKLPAVMNALYPKWEPSTQLTGAIANGALERATLRDAKLWESDGRRGLAVLVQRWSGDGCKGAPCEPETVDLAVVEWAGGKMALVSATRGELKAGEQLKVSFDATPVRVDRATTLVGVREELEKDGRSQTTLKLFKQEASALKLVFSRLVRDARAGQKAVDAGCLATLSTDDLEGVPYPIKVVERCQQTKRGAIEFWRWQGSEYKLHGPTSHAAEDELTEDENDQ